MIIIMISFIQYPISVMNQDPGEITSLVKKLIHLNTVVIFAVSNKS